MAFGGDAQLSCLTRSIWSAVSRCEFWTHRRAPKPSLKLPRSEKPSQGLVAPEARTSHVWIPFLSKTSGCHGRMDWLATKFAVHGSRFQAACCGEAIKLAQQNFCSGLWQAFHPLNKEPFASPKQNLAQLNAGLYATKFHRPITFSASCIKGAYTGDCFRRESSMHSCI